MDQNNTVNSRIWSLRSFLFYIFKRELSPSHVVASYLSLYSLPEVSNNLKRGMLRAHVSKMAKRMHDILSKLCALLYMQKRLVDAVMPRFLFFFSNTTCRDFGGVSICAAFHGTDSKTQEHVFDVLSGLFLPFKFKSGEGTAHVLTSPFLEYVLPNFIKLLILDLFVSNGSKWDSGHRMFCLFSLFPLHPKMNCTRGNVLDSVLCSNIICRISVDSLQQHLRLDDSKADKILRCSVFLLSPSSRSKSD
jgi:hypothetical protein